VPQAAGQVLTDGVEVWHYGQTTCADIGNEDDMLVAEPLSADWRGLAELTQW
jgi:hypothetical protein